MEVRVIFDTGNGWDEFEYSSRYERINTKGIREEVHQQLRSKYGLYMYRHSKIIDWFRVEEEK